MQAATMYQSQERPPFVRFETRAHGLHAELSLEAGRPIPRMVTFACITPHGSKDVIEKLAEEWLAQIRAQASQGIYNPTWAKHFADAYEAWKLGNELPREGTPIQGWQRLTDQEQAIIKAAGITTVEDLAAVPDSGLQHIGMGGRVWRDEAIAWIKGAKDIGIVTAENAQLRRDLEASNAKQAEQQALIEGMAARLERLESADTPRRGKGT